jgi:hypothetical protein
VNAALVQRFSLSYRILSCGRFRGDGKYCAEDLEEIMQKATSVQSFEVSCLGPGEGVTWSISSLRRARRILAKLLLLKRVFWRVRGYSLRFVVEDAVAEEDVRNARR